MKRLARILAQMFAVTNEKGVTAIEYGLLASLIAVAIITAVSLVGTNLSRTFTTLSGKL
jgi:pilus assembly protein Flp/PilA